MGEREKAFKKETEKGNGFYERISDNFFAWGHFLTHSSLDTASSSTIFKGQGIINMQLYWQTKIHISTCTVVCQCG